MSGQVMVPLDGSTFAEEALPLALAIARRTHGMLHLVRVRASLPLDDNGVAEEEYLARIAAQIEPQLPDRITHSVLTNEIGPLDYPPPPSGVVADVLARHAVEHDAALVVMTTHGRSGFRRAWLGSVADSLMRIAPRPVLVVRPEDGTRGVPPAERAIHHVLVPLDGSETAEQALPYAQQLGDLFGARYSLVRVVARLAWNVSNGPLGTPIAVHSLQSSADAAHEYLERAAARLRQQHFMVATQVLDGASPAPAILEYAARTAADVIVMSTAGAGGMRRLLLGSVADKIVRSGEVPVLVCNQRHLDTAAPPLAAPAAAAAGTI